MYNIIVIIRFVLSDETGSYTLVPGVFLFLGYSEKDEQLLKSLDIMKFEIKDLVYTIQKFIQEHMVFNVSITIHDMKNVVVITILE